MPLSPAENAASNEAWHASFAWLIVASAPLMKLSSRCLLDATLIIYRCAISRRWRRRCHYALRGYALAELFDLRVMFI